MKQRSGFTLVELMVLLVIVSVTVAVAIPNFQQFLMSQRATTKANEFLTALTFARSEALKRGVPVSVCASTDGASCSGQNTWQTGWIVFNDNGATLGTVESGEAVIRQHEAFTDGATLDDDSGNGATSITYQGDGLLDAGVALDFELVPAGCQGNNMHAIVIAPTGRASIQREACP